jgi:hypothetical protein
MIDGTFRAVLRAFEDEFENATARCKAEVESEVFDPDALVVELTDIVDVLLEDAEPGPKDGFIVIERTAIEALRVAISDMSGGDVEQPFRDFTWEMRKALREFKEALVLHSETGADA